MSLSVWILHLIFGLRAFTFNDLVNKIQTARTWMVPFVIFDCRINFGKSHNGWVKFILWITYSYNYIIITLSSLMIIRMKSKYLTNILVIAQSSEVISQWCLENYHTRKSRRIPKNTSRENSVFNFTGKKSLTDAFLKMFKNLVIPAL